MCFACGHPSLSHGRRIARRSFLVGPAALAAATLARDALARTGPPAKPPPAPPKPDNVLSPDEALARLMEGNKRYRIGVARRHDFVAERGALVGGQNPFAAILSCADSRVAPEYAFDSGRGDLFVVRVAGNFANPDGIASFEYAVAELKTPLLLVLGHDACGAVKATIDSLRDKTPLPGHLPTLVEALAPGVKASAGQKGDPVENAIRENVRLTVAALKAANPILSAAVEERRAKVVGGVYRLSDGAVELIA
ncbi:MAG TPA: carbonic anhydrase [Methylocystis sp.]|nr:carbonic anhydrase [Methylocystis sp.]